MTKYTTIGTHSQTFHSDEALAIYMLRLLDEFKDCKIIRSRDMTVLENLDVLVDVGSIYDHSTLRYDHHQRSFTETFSPNHTIRLSSAGLIYMHYGKRIIEQQTSLKDPSQIQSLYEHIYDIFIKAMDAIDNGVSQYPSSIEPTFQDYTSLSSRVSRLNPQWNENVSEEELMIRFHKAIDICGEEFNSALNIALSSWLPCRQQVQEALEKRFEKCPSGEIVFFDSYIPWKSHFFQIQKEEEENGEKSSLRNVYSIVYPSGDGKWRYLNVPIFETSFETRLDMPDAWKGLRDSELDEQTGIPGGLFIHHSGFTGGHQTLEGVTALLMKAIENMTNKKSKME